MTPGGHAQPARLTGIARLSHPRTQRQRRARTNERLLAALAESIAEKGLERTTLAEVGMRAGYSRSIVGVQYGSKQELLTSFLRTTLQSSRPEQTSADAIGLDWITSRIDVLEAQARENQVLLRALLVACLESVGPSDGSLSAMKDEVRRWLDEHEAVTAEAIRAGQRNGSIRRDLDANLVAARIMDLMIASALRWAMAPPDHRLKSQLASLRLFLAKSLDEPTGET